MELTDETLMTDEEKLGLRNCRIKEAEIHLSRAIKRGEKLEQRRSARTPQVDLPPVIQLGDTVSFVSRFTLYSLYKNRA